MLDNFMKLEFNYGIFGYIVEFFLRSFSFIVEVMLREDY